VPHSGSAEPVRRSRVRTELTLRVASAALLVPLAIGVAYWGGWVFAIFWTAAALVTLSEWTSLIAEQNRKVLIAGAVLLLVGLCLLESGYPAAGLIALVTGVFVVPLFERSENRLWMACGVFYSAAIAAPAILLRSDERAGFVAIMFLFAIVWATDIAAYFIGRTVGGPKLMPRVSPKKTWAGAVAGLLAAMLAAALVAKAAMLSATCVLIAIALVLSVCAQGGDLFESWVKRRFGAKDSGRLIPGHGGLMDRLDGFVAAALVAAFIGVLRGGIEAPGQGLLLW
jgi:phosphatidate cytidylyltransferase